MTDSIQARLILIFALLVLILAELCLLLWGGEGSWSQETRAGLLLLGVVGLGIALRELRR